MQKLNIYSNKSVLFNFENVLMFQKKVCYLGLERYLLKVSQLNEQGNAFRRTHLDRLTRVEDGEEPDIGEKLCI